MSTLHSFTYLSAPGALPESLKNPTASEMVTYWNQSTQDYCLQLFNVIALIPVSNSTSKKVANRIDFLGSTLLNYAKES